jgi:hypothetical protein
MLCKSCGSDNRKQFNGEIAIHFPGLENLDRPLVWVFPTLLICMNCGTAEFALPEADLCLLATGKAAGAGQ